MTPINIYKALGERLEGFGTTERSRAIIDEAMAENPWFTAEDIVRAVDAIRCDMLQNPELEAWIKSYPTPQRRERVALIMAGNLPLVGFFDLMCVTLSGHECHYKPSSKDSVLMEYIVSELRSIEPTIALHRFNPEAEYDMLIATGGDAAMHHFDTHYPTTRRLLRGSRHSVAVLSGRESDEELRGLARDITAYSGLGCRSVSMIFVPRGHMPNIVSAQPASDKLRRNLRSERALRTMTAQPFTDCGGFILVPGSEFSTSLAVVTLSEYDTRAEVEEWIMNNGEHIQCVVSHLENLSSALPFGRTIPFGQAQHPTLTDWADGIDTMKWLCN